MFIVSGSMQLIKHVKNSYLEQQENADLGYVENKLIIENNLNSAIRSPKFILNLFINI